MRQTKYIRLLAAACAGVMMLGAPATQRPLPVSAGEAREIARDAYIYAYPMVLMQVTRQVGTNVAEPTGTSAPLNQFAHVRQFHDPSFTPRGPAECRHPL